MRYRRRRKRKAGVDKVRYSFSLRDVYHEYKFDFSKEEQLDRREFLAVVDSIVDKIVDAVIKDKQTFKLPRGKGKFMMVKDKPKHPKPFLENYTKSMLLTDGWRFYLYWFKRKDEATKFPNRSIYVIKTSKKTNRRIRDHIVDLAMDPYKKDYNTILRP